MTALRPSAARSRAASVVLLPVRAVTYVVRGGGGGARGGSPIAGAAQLLLRALLHHAPAGRGGNAFRQALRGLQARPRPGSRRVLSCAVVKQRARAPPWAAAARGVLTSGRRCACAVWGEVALAVARVELGKRSAGGSRAACALGPPLGRPVRRGGASKRGALLRTLWSVAEPCLQRPGTDLGVPVMSGQAAADGGPRHALRCLAELGLWALGPGRTAQRPRHPPPVASPAPIPDDQVEGRQASGAGPRRPRPPSRPAAGAYRP